MAKNLGLCRKTVSNCEECEYWEPIPFHHHGGVCMSRNVVIKLATSKTMSIEKLKQPVPLLT